MTLYRSLAVTGVNFRFYVLCLDEQTYNTLNALAISNLQPIRLAEVESWDNGLTAVKSKRSVIEYYFTLSPVLPLYIFEHWQDIEIITYLDADLYFYSSPEVLFEELGDNSILITEHRFPEYLQDKLVYGRYNVQFQAFRRDEQGLACLRRWRGQCLNWCYDRLEEDRYADQKYLEEWPELYDRLVVVQHKGAGVAPWNWATFTLTLQAENLLIAEQPLVFYHFHGVKILHPHIISHGLSDFGLMPAKIRRWLYAGYIASIKEAAVWLASQNVQVPVLGDQRVRGPSLKSIRTLSEIFRKVWVQLMWV